MIQRRHAGPAPAASALRASTIRPPCWHPGRYWSWAASPRPAIPPTARNCTTRRRESGRPPGAFIQRAMATPRACSRPGRCWWRQAYLATSVTCKAPKSMTRRPVFGRRSGIFLPRAWVTPATLLPSGKVLVAGGVNSEYLDNAELFDPATGTWTATGSLSTRRAGHTATLLPSGDVLVAGGDSDTLSSQNSLRTAEMYRSGASDDSR